ALRRDRRRRPRRPDGRAGRRLRLPRAERGREDDVPAHDARPDPADRGLGPALRARPAPGRRQGAPGRRRLRRGARVLPIPLRPPARRGRGALQPRRDHPEGADRLRGLAGRAARERGQRLPPAEPGAGAGARRLPRSGGCGAGHVRRRRGAVPGRRAVGRRAVDRTRPGTDRGDRTRAADGESRGALPRPHRGRGAAGGGGRMSAVAKVYRWEIAKLLAQKRTYLGLGSAMLVPLVFVIVLVLQTGRPDDVPLGRYIRDTGLAVPFVVLFFMSIWGFPLITALVAGDIVAAESHNATLKT